jgi:hypothetical protein
MSDDRSYLNEERFRAIAGWLVFLGTGVFSIVFLTFIVFHACRPGSWVVEVVRQHFAATVGLPLAAIASMCVVLLFKYATGPIEFKALGFQFRGASGPIVLWVMCLLAITLGIWILW